MKIELPQELKIYNVKDTWAQVFEILKKNGKGGKKGNVISAEKLEHFDGAGLQLLFVLFREHAMGEASFRLEGLSGTLAEKLKLYGFPLSGEGKSD